MPGATGSAAGTPTPLHVGGSLGASVQHPALSQLTFFDALRQKWPAGPVIGPTGLSVLLKINVNQNVGGLCAEAAVY